MSPSEKEGVLDEKGPECICGLDTSKNGLRYDIICPKHDGEFTVPWPEKDVARVGTTGGETDSRTARDEQAGSGHTPGPWGVEIEEEPAGCRFTDRKSTRLNSSHRL